MAKIQYSATRMQLLKLKKRTALAKRGHKLLKDKFDELMRRFLELIKDYKGLRDQMEQAIADALSGFLLARAVMPPANIEEALIVPKDLIQITAGKKTIMNIEVPDLSVNKDIDLYHYGFAETAIELDDSFNLFAKALPLMVEVAAKEKSIELLAGEIEKTRRRVNALEYVLIPSLQEGVKSITMRLEELERSNLTRLMKVKDIVRGH